MVWVGAAWIKLVQVGAVLCKRVQVNAFWCSLVQFGVVWRTFGVFLCSLVLTAAQLAQLDKRRSTEREVAGSYPGRTNTRQTSTNG